MVYSLYGRKEERGYKYDSQIGAGLWILRQHGMRSEPSLHQGRPGRATDFLAQHRCLEDGRALPSSSGHLERIEPRPGFWGVRCAARRHSPWTSCGHQRVPRIKGLSRVRSRQGQMKWICEFSHATNHHSGRPQ